MYAFEQLQTVLKVSHDHFSQKLDIVAKARYVMYVVACTYLVLEWIMARSFWLLVHHLWKPFCSRKPHPPRDVGPCRWHCLIGLWFQLEQNSYVFILIVSRKATGVFLFKDMLLILTNIHYTRKTYSRPITSLIWTNLGEFIYTR